MRQGHTGSTILRNTLALPFLGSCFVIICVCSELPLPEYPKRLQREWDVTKRITVLAFVFYWCFPFPTVSPLCVHTHIYIGSIYQNAIVHVKISVVKHGNMWFYRNKPCPWLYNNSYNTTMMASWKQMHVCCRLLRSDVPCYQYIIKRVYFSFHGFRREGSRSCGYCLPCWSVEKPRKSLIVWSACDDLVIAVSVLFFFFPWQSMVASYNCTM